jgi:hypothetical protein
MRKTALIGLAIVILAAIATGVVTAFAQSTSQPQNNNSVPDPRPGYTYYVGYNQTDGSILYAVACLPSNGATCTPTLQSGQSLMYITDQPVLVKQLFTDAYNSKLGNWRVNLQTHQLASTGAPSSASVVPSIFGLTLVGLALPTSASIGVFTSGALIWRRARRHSDI